MSSERHERVSALFLRARDVEPSARRAFLESESSGDDALVEEVMSLFDADEPDFLSAPVPTSATEPPMPERIGNYRIRRVLGEGGMGIVYLAEQERPRRTVALKVIRPLFASKRALQRFEHESQILARLKHPGIAQIYEAGVATTPFGSQPYFAMEFVDGEPLDRDVEKRRFSIRERLERMAQIADIVQHAHQQGVVHRDLKPANILIDRDGQPKVLDFGVARATDSDIQTTTAQTDVGQLLGTVPYMSPEQVEGDPYNVDTRSDVYALGVITYRLLTGAHPYDLERRSITDAVRLIRDTEPPSLGSVSRSLRGDVDTIVSKALEKDRSRRYQSAAEFAGDIRRHLADEPIVARPATTMYQLRKFARRHRPVVVSVAVIFLVLLVGVATTTAGWVYALDRAEEARLERAAAREAQAESEAARLDADDARLEAEEEAGTARAARDFLKGMLATLNADASTGYAVTVGEMLRVGARNVLTAFPDRPLVEAEIHVTLASGFRGLGAWDEAIEQARLAQAIRTRELGTEHRATIEAFLLECNILVDADRTPDVALELARRATRTAEEALGGQDVTTLGARGVVAKTLMRQDRHGDAVDVLREVIETQVALHGPDSIAAATNRGNLAICLQRIGRLEEAEAEYLEARRVFIASGRPNSTEALTLLDHYANLLADTGRLDDAEAMKREVLAISREIYGDDNVNVYRVMNNLATTLATANRNPEEQRLLLGEVLEFYRSRYGEEHQGTLQARNNLGAFLLKSDDPEAAAPIFRRVAEVLSDLYGPTAIRTFTARQNLGRALLMMERFEESEEVYASVVQDAAAAFPADHWLLAGFRMNHARALIGLERLEEARVVLDLAEPVLESSFGATHAYTQTCYRARIALLDATGEDASSYRSRLRE